MRNLLIISALFVLIPPLMAQQNPVIIINWDPDSTVVSGEVEIRGTVNPANLFAYFLEVSPYTALGSLKPSWIPITQPDDTPVINGALGVWDTTAFGDGIYQLRLHVALETGDMTFYTLAPIAVSNSGATLSAAPVTAIETPDPSIRGPKEAPLFSTLPTNPAPIPPEEPAVVIEPLVDVEVGVQVVFFHEETQEMFKNAGLQWLKWQIPFRINESAALLNEARDRIERSKEAGFKVLLSILGEVSELRERGRGYYPLFAQFLGQVAALGPDAIEVWNEMNLDREWPQGQINPAAYVEMLEEAYTAIKATNPEVMVITGALAPTGAEGAFGLDRVWNDDRYMNGMAQAGADRFADCIGAHYNEGIIPPDRVSGDPRDDFPTRYFPRMLDRTAIPFQNSGLPLCFTELGYLSADGYGTLPEFFAWAENTSVEEQALWLKQAVEIADQYERLPVKLIIIFNGDFERFDDDPQAGYAIIRPGGVCPACEELRAILAPQLIQ